MGVPFSNKKNTEIKKKNRRKGKIKKKNKKTHLLSSRFTLNQTILMVKIQDNTDNLHAGNYLVPWLSM